MSNLVNISFSYHDSFEYHIKEENQILHSLNLNTLIHAQYFCVEKKNKKTKVTKWMSISEIKKQKKITKRMLTSVTQFSETNVDICNTKKNKNKVMKQISTSATQFSETDVDIHNTKKQKKLQNRCRYLQHNYLRDKNIIIGGTGKKKGWWCSEKPLSICGLDSNKSIYAKTRESWVFFFM